LASGNGLHGMETAEILSKEGIMKSTEKRQQTSSIGNFHKFQNENLA